MRLWRARGLLRRSSSIDGDWMDWEKERSLLNHGLGLEGMASARGEFLLNDSGPANGTNDV